MDTDNLTKQIEEVEALSSIYGSDWTKESDRSYNIKIKENKMEAILYVTLPDHYPGQGPPKYELSSPMMDRKLKEELHKALDTVYLENAGDIVIYHWVEKIRETLLSIKHPEKNKNVNKVITPTVDVELPNIACPEIFTGEVIVDRKSSFQGHAAVVHTLDEVKLVLNKLMQNKKVANATHNMYAYRIEVLRDGSPSTLLQDCDDDGEAHAGGRMLHLLQILQQTCTLVVVSRWYGGIQLGPDRFRHINNAARQVLTQAGMIKK